MKVSNKSSHFSNERVRSTRPLDYIYDPLFTFSGPKGYYKTAHESYQSAAEFTVRPIFDSMFSDMVRYPRATLVLRPSHQMPQSIDPSYLGKVKATAQEKTVTAEVTGSDRYKYFRRPVTEKQSGAPASRFPLLGAENITNLGLMAPPATAQKLRERLSATTRECAAQTDFRESETQTQPWTPPYIAHGRTTPEVLHLEQLTWGNGLPPGQHEVDVVERLRMKQAWEAQLPPLDSEANIKKRYKLISDMEKSDWEFREKEIQAIHDERMKKSEQLLEQHMLMNRTRLTYRMAFLEDDINKRKEKKLQLIHRDKERALRKLCMKEKGYNPKCHKMNILEEHLHHTSEIYAPMRRYGTSFKNKHEVLAEKFITVDDKDIFSLENSVTFRPAFDYNKASQPKKQTELCVRETRWTMENLVKLHKDLQMLRLKQNKNQDAFFTHTLEQIQKPLKIRNVPSVPLISDSKERLYQAAITIQRVIHGRAMQLQIHQGRAIWKEMLKEIKGADNMSDNQQNCILLLKDHMNENTRTINMIENVLGMSVGSTIGETLNLLATELLRFKSESIAHSQALQSECARWHREVPEGGRRQKEAVRREEHSLMFTQLLEVYQDSINELLEGLVSKAREHEAKIQALEHAKEMALLAESEQATTVVEEEEDPVSADLLLQFIAPEGLRELTRTCMLILKQKYKEARQELVQGRTSEPLEESLTTKECSPETRESLLQTGKRLLQTGESSLQTDKSSLQTGKRSLQTGESSLQTDESSLQTGQLTLSVHKNSLSAKQPPTLSLDTFSSTCLASDLNITSTPITPIRHSSVRGQVETDWATVPECEIESEPEMGTWSSDERSTSALVDSAESTALPARFGLTPPSGTSPDERLLARVMRDMCYVAGYLLHTAAKILNKALQISSIPRGSFEEALRRTMEVINGAREEIARIILPKPKTQPFILPSKIASKEIILEATKIVDDIISKVKERIQEIRDKEYGTADSNRTVPQIMVESETQSQAKQIIEDVIKEAQRIVIQAVAEDFLTDLMKEAQSKVDCVLGDWYTSK